MLKKISVSALALAVAGFAAPAMAAPVNPWGPVEVPITVTVQQMVELFTDESNVPLTIADGGENANSLRASAQDVLYHLHNVPVEVSVALSTDIPDNTQFFVLYNGEATWATRLAAATEKAVGWRRDNGSYLGVTGAFPNQVSGTDATTPIVVFSAASNAGYNTGMPEAQELVQYFADAGNIMPAPGSSTFNVVWTIASTAP